MVHLFKSHGYNIVLDVNSGIVHSVDELTYDFIDLCRTISVDEAVEKLASRGEERAELSEIKEEVEALIADGTLFSKDIYEEVYPKITTRPHVVKALCLHIAHDCNLACRYCFAEEGEYHGKRELMSAETGKKALDFLVKASGTRKNLEVDFFGGEPLLNFGVVKEIAAYGRELEKKYDKNFRFTLTTNGVLLNDEVMEFVNKECSNVVLSIDGRKEVNDKMRPFRKGVGSYDLIVPKFIKMAESRNQERYYVRGTYTHFNLDFSEDVKHLAELGFKQISVEPVVSSPSDDYALREEDVPKLCEEYDKLADYMLEKKKEGKGFNFFHFMIDMDGGPCLLKRLSGCGSGSEYLAVTPSGDLYPCHQFVGEDGFLLGTVDTGVTNGEMVKKFCNCNIYTRPDCKDCFAKLFCSGGCTANSYKYGTGLNGNYKIGCELQKKRVECALMLKIAEAEEDEQSDCK